MDKKFALMASFCFILVLGNLIYMPQIVSEFRNSQKQYIELSEDYQRIQEAYEYQLNNSGPRYTGNPFATELWPGQLQSENITGMHWYSYTGTGLQNVTDNVLGEGEYTTWTHVWTRDYGVGVWLNIIIVDNYGRCYATDQDAGKAFFKDYLGNEINTPGGMYCTWLSPMGGLHYSATGKYVLGVTGATWLQIDVWRYGVLIFKCDTFAVLPDSDSIEWFAISTNGKFIAVIIQSDATAEDRYLMLWEGS